MSFVVWLFLDGKPGHESQSRGLIQALKRRVAVDLHEFHAGQVPWAYGQWLLGRFKGGRHLPRPDLILGAGHGTHGPMLAARRVYGGKIVLLMRPSLPLYCFDYAIIPEHDNPGSKPNVIASKGVLNAIRPAVGACERSGLLLIGGPSKHHGWDDCALTEQVEQVLKNYPKVTWWLTTSRRTPSRTVEMLLALNDPRLTVVPFEETEPGWVGARLETCGRVWVSEDSISMIFESLTAGARVGLFKVPAKGKKSRVQMAIEQLKNEGRVIVHGRETDEGRSFAPLAEADRVADLLLNSLG